MKKLNQILNSNLEVMENSNQFPAKDKKKVDQTPLNERAKFILLGLKDNCPDLYKQIKAVK